MSGQDLPIRLEIPRDITADVRTLVQRGVDVNGLSIPELCAAINELRRESGIEEVTEDSVNDFIRTMQVLALVSEIEQLDLEDS